MENKETKFLTRTAMLLALALIFQSIRLLPFMGLSAWYSPYVIGTLVNLCMIIAVGTVGLSAGVVIALATPIVAYFQGQIPFPIMMPVVAIGNILLVFVFNFAMKLKFQKYMKEGFSVILAAVCKWLFLFLSVSYILKIFVPAVTESQLLKISASMNVPQIITALAGGFLGVIIISMLKRAKVVK